MICGIFIALYALSWRSKHFTTLCEGLCQTAYLGANCSHTVHNLIRENSRIHWCPQNRIRNKHSHWGQCQTVCGFFNVPHQYCETGPTVYRPYPRRLESLTICRYHYKGSTFSSVRPWVLVQLTFEPATSCMAVLCSTNWANWSAFRISCI